MIARKLCGLNACSILCRTIERECMSDKKIFHIANNFISSKVHRNLIIYLSRKQRVKQQAFVPVRKKEEVGVNSDFSNNECEIKYAYCLRPFLRFFPLIKVLWVTVVCIYRIGRRKLNDADVIVAHTLWSDGMVAFFIHLIHNTNYLLVVRNTDINIFLPMLPHYRFMMKWSMRRAKAVIFISYAHKQRFCRLYPSLFKAAAAIHVIPNGLDDFWINNVPLQKNRIENNSKNIIFVGRFDKNKNLPAIIHAVEYSRSVDPQFVLTLVGGTVDELKKLCNIKALPSWVNVIEHIEEKECLITLYRQSMVFIMPSFHETFGLVYIEALSQGCCFIYTKDEGVDGYFNNEDFAVAVDPENIQQISDAILLLARQFPHGVSHQGVIKSLTQFSWTSVAATYLQLIDL